MLVLTIRTDKPESEIGLYNDGVQLACVTWQAHRQLAETIHVKLEGILQDQGKKAEDIEGIVLYKGPGSFTGLRIGASVASALAYSFSAPIVGANGDAWQQAGIARLRKGENDVVVQLEYGSAAVTTQPKK